MSYERRKIRVGRVVSDKMDQTVTVVFEWRRNHALYKKSVRRRTRFTAHDPSTECKIGDLVRIIEGRPYSKTKRWKVLDILEHEEIAELQPEEIVVEDPSVLTARVAQPEEAVAAPITVDEIADIGEYAVESAVEAEEVAATEEETEPVAEAEAEAEEDTATEEETEPIAEAEAEAEEDAAAEDESEPEAEAEEVAATEEDAAAGEEPEAEAAADEPETKVDEETATEEDTDSEETKKP